jgi:predicted ABC-type exoprotein transport system permease subunit
MKMVMLMGIVKVVVIMMVIEVTDHRIPSFLFLLVFLFLLKGLVMVRRMKTSQGPPSTVRPCNYMCVCVCVCVCV